MNGILIRKEDYECRYFLADIKTIRYGKSKDFYDIADIRANDIKPMEPMMYIEFNNGDTSSFGKGWKISFY